MTTAHLSEREAQAKAEIGHTDVGRGTAWGLIAAFLAILVSVSLVDAVAGRWGPAFSILSEAPGAAARAGSESGFFAANRALLAKMNDFEDELEQDSLVSETVQGPFQWLLTAWGGAGNEQVYVGRDGRLYFRPGFDLVTGPGFLEPDRLELRRRGGDSWETAPEPNPIPAILDLHRALEARGIDLIVLPAPTKASIQPQPLAPGIESESLPLQNASYDRFVLELRDAGVEVLDPAPDLVRAARETGEPQYLERDSHWRPEAVERVAGLIGESLLGPPFSKGRKLSSTSFESNPGGGPGGAPPLEKGETEGDLGGRERAVRAPGDLAALLNLPASRPIWTPQEVRIRQVVGPDGEIVRPDPKSPVLLLGDSFTNVFSQEDLGWGTGAGLAEQLSYELGAPIDWIALNAGGASAARRELAARMARGERPLEGKAVVIYEFAARELAVGDWVRVEYRDGKSAGPESPDSLQIRGRIESVAPVPDPSTTPYTQAIVALHVSRQDGDDLLVYAWGMRDRRLTPAARLAAGDVAELTLVPWQTVSEDLGSVQRLELGDPELFALEPWWAEEIKPNP